MGNGGGGDLDGVPAGVEDGGVVGDEDVDAVDVGGGATRSRWWWCSEETRRAAPRRRGRRGGGAAASGEERAASGRRGGDEDDGAASRRRGSGVGRGEGKGIEGEGERGDRFGPGIDEGEGTILMAHHPSVRHKYIHTNGAPRPGAPLVIFFDFCSSQQVIFHLT